MSEQRSFNRLADEKSSYLLQHKDNPIHWWPYGPEAIQRAKDENKPIFLSIGYSSCHWCHVMAHESFSNNEVAEYMNENFINIKVDREEFPDLDHYYQTAAQLFTQQGGWPLSAFLLPDMRPFFVGTYYPLTSKDNETTFLGLANELKRAFNEDHDKVLENAEKVTTTIEEGLTPKDKVEFQGHFPAPMAILEAVKDFKDEENGGFGSAPKFPQFSFYEWALEQMLEGMITKEHGDHIIKSLERMLLGGICDHPRGGIHRYSIDETWTVPHFEKMLYDQAGFLKVLSKLSLIYGSPLVYDAIFKTLEYLKTEMLGEEKFFFSAQDADSEGVEGLYFTYTLEEFEDALNNFDDESELLSKNRDNILKWFNVTEKGNFDRGLNVITLNKDLLQEIYTQEGWDTVRKVRDAILKDRKGRIPPATDNKGIASWNFMLLSALVDVIQYCKIDALKNQATELFNTLIEGLYNNFLIAKDGQGMKIRHSTTKDVGMLYFEDYVFFAEAMLRVYEVTGNPVFKENFKDTINFLLKEFKDESNFKTRSLSMNEHHLYPNQNVTNFDTGFKSPASTFVILLRRAAILFKDRDFTDQVEAHMEAMTHEVLKNPLGSGEALRALTYPKEAYRTIKVPKNWLQNDKFVNFLPYFLSRFVLDYYEGEEDRFELCNHEACELTGIGVDEFINTLVPKNDQGQEAE
ncbi:DUF255 domain-containing protein [Halobacteriovorax sp. GB3]|uniref:thioredoxin domain-containing protein n=1 Tax=Halobacteriovorax sp. GB3 TaxID=2719615 RepID=UPI00235DE5B9|nr:DUF255 domain-containing protein [Halobacteriovorax sp. GB3]MDD0852381.1 DUF255 domain-containing protein [Halobacteriovorax sp. GB3]